MNTPTAEIDNDDLGAVVQILRDREAIRECIYRYCRGVDRGDEAVLRATYWPDAIDCHGPYRGSATGFCDWVIEKLKHSGRMSHMIGNVVIELHAHLAAVESYFHAIQEEYGPEGNRVEVFLSGRYLDRFEKRSGEWKVVARTVVYDWARCTPMPTTSEDGVFGVARQPRGARYPDDAFYTLRADIWERVKHRT